MAVTNKPFFDQFPTIDYDINHQQYPVYDKVTDIFFRIGVVRNTLNQISSYYNYEIQDNETPDILAAKVYNDANAGWIILLANNIIDPQWEWPLNYRNFQNYIINKYGSIEAAKIGIHHYEKVITRTADGLETVTRFEIDREKKTLNRPSVPYNYFIPFVESVGSEVDSTTITVDSTLYTVDIDFDYDYRTGSIPITQDVNTYNVDSTTITEVIRGEAISYYDYEEQLNESKRLIKIIKNQYYPAIMREFGVLSYQARIATIGSSAATDSFIRRLS